jgi:hypothetical protein
MRSPIRAFKTDLQELLAYGPALLAGAVNYQLYKRRERSSCTIASNVVISLTSIPARLSKLHNCIRSLLAQRQRAERVLLYLTREECGDVDIPIKLQRLQDAGLEIRYVDTNVRSLNKIYHALADFPDKTIVTCDDDKLYPPGWLKGLVGASMRHQGCIVCNRSREIAIGADGQIAPYRQWPSTEHANPSLAVLPMGVGGVLYPPDSLHPEVRDAASYLALSGTSDDLWLKVMSLRQGTACLQVAPKVAVYASIPFWGGEKLSVGNIWHGGNDQNWARLISHFDLDLKSLVHCDAQ